MSIGSMPIELVELIVEHVSPNDIEAFGLTCNNLHHIASSRLEEHRDLNRKYSKMDMSAKAAKNPLYLMLELCSQPRTLYYPKHAEFRDTENPCNWHGEDSEEVIRNHIRKITGLTPWILYDEMMTHFEGSAGLTQDELLAVSLCMFPNLRSIRFEACGGPFKHTTRAIKHVLAADTGSYGSQYLSKLSKVTVASRFLVDSAAYSGSHHSWRFPL